MWKDSSDWELSQLHLNQCEMLRLDFIKVLTMQDVAIFAAAPLVDRTD